MNSLSMEGLWTVMNEYNFEPVDTCDKEELLCILCKKLMVDARQSVTCGCRYCYKCISEYLRDGEKSCPGGGKKCNEEFLILDTDVVRDRRINGLITKTRVKCPHRSCEATMEVCQVEDHLRLCSNVMLGCPFKVIGCDNEDEEKQSILRHIGNDAFTHSQLLIEWVQNMKNDIDALKASFDVNKLEMAKDSRLKDMKILELEEEVNRLRNMIVVAPLVERPIEGTVALLAESEPSVARQRSNDFVWHIEEFSKKCATSVYSDPFLVDEYKFCLSMFIYSDGVGLNCVLMRGDKDDQLQWPMKKQVTLSILDQSTMTAFESLSFIYDNYANKSAFERPTCDRANFIGANPFVMYSAIKQQASVVVKDSIIVACIIADHH